LLAIIGLLAVRTKFDFRGIGSHHEVGGYMLSVLGTLYSVVLGFMVVDVSAHVQEAKVNIGAEINSLVNLYRISDAFPQQHKEEFENACISYAKAVAEDEWEKMPKGIVSRRAWESMNQIWAAIKNFKPQTTQDEAFFGAIMENFDNLSSSRRIRLIMAQGRVSPILWMVLVVGAASTIGFTYLFSVDRLFSQVLMTLLVAITLTLNFYLIVVNSNPFVGDFRIPPKMFEVTAKVMEMKGGIPDNLNGL